MKCAYRFCEETFIQKRKNQKYCDAECCKQEMNARAKDIYAERRLRQTGSRRICRGCGNILSQYNDENKCVVCLGLVEKNRTDKLRNLVNGTG